MGRKIRNFFYIGRNFKKEFRRQLRMLIVITLGFTIAFTWRQTIFDLSQSFVQLILNIKGSTALTLLTSTFITLISIILIYIAAHFLKDDTQVY